MFLVPFPPSVNQYWRFVNKGRLRCVLISRRGRTYREMVVVALRAQYGGFQPLDQRLRVQLILNPPDKRKRDVDNYTKALLDALTHAGVWNDDEQIDELTITRGPVISGGRVYVKIGVIDAPTQTNIAPVDDVGRGRPSVGHQSQFGRTD
jgi:crossover junction endodeoxyribonuclease RusA